MNKWMGPSLILSGLFVALLFSPSWAAGDSLAHEFALGEPLSPERLTAVRGMNNPSLWDELFDTESAVESNQVVYQGDMKIQQSSKLNDSFNKSRGVFTVVQNSGNNVLIQTLTLVNINFR